MSKLDGANGRLFIRANGLFFRRDADDKATIIKTGDGREPFWQSQTNDNINFAITGDDASWCSYGACLVCVR